MKALDELSLSQLDMRIILFTMFFPNVCKSINISTRKGRLWGTWLKEKKDEVNGNLEFSNERERDREQMLPSQQENLFFQ